MAKPILVYRARLRVGVVEEKQRANHAEAERDRLARLVDDMAALLREIVEIDDRFGAHTKECITDPNDACGLCLELAAEQSHSIEAAREVAALHHARQQEGT